MKTVSNFVMVVVISLIVSGCASTKQFVRLPDQSKTIEDPEKARIYVIRPPIFWGCAIPIEVCDGETLIGKTGYRGFLCWEREPGKIEVVSREHFTFKLPLEVKKGSIYYIRQDLLIFGLTKLRLMTEDEGKKKLGKCNPPRIMN